MNIILRRSQTLLGRQVFRKFPILRSAHHLDQDWMPGPYPKNEEERKAAAKKYNLLPEEYEPYDPKWDWGSGDYPCLPNRCDDDKDPYEAYEDMNDSRNYMEPYHRQYEILGPYSMTLNDPALENPGAVILFLLFFLVFTDYYINLSEKYRPVTIMKPKHLPANGDHYHYPTTNTHVYEPTKYPEGKY